MHGWPWLGIRLQVTDRPDSQHWKGKIFTVSATCAYVVGTWQIDCDDDTEGQIIGEFQHMIPDRSMRQISTGIELMQ